MITARAGKIGFLDLFQIPQIPYFRSSKKWKKKFCFISSVNWGKSAKDIFLSHPSENWIIGLSSL
jgi:hypothetical protein